MRTFPMYFIFGTEEGQWAWSGKFTADDLLNIPREELREEDHLSDSFARVAGRFDDPRYWTRVMRTSEMLRANQGRHFSRDELIEFLRGL